MNRPVRLMLLLLVAAGTTATGAGAEPGNNPVNTVAAVDIDRYVGVWHEVAKIPNRFQKQCVRGTTATYTLRADGRLTVLNECDKEDGTRSRAEGLAKVVAGTGNARLEVSFVSFLGWRPFWGDYWILGLDPLYQWVAVGTPDRKYGWILARAATLDDESLAAAYGMLEHNGYRRDAFQPSLP